jgi:hypothetical protein
MAHDEIGFEAETTVVERADADLVGGDVAFLEGDGIPCYNKVCYNI